MSFLTRLREHPKGFWFVFWGELAERASFYGMRTVLALYLVEILGYPENRAGSIMLGFMAAAYIAPLLGGFIADRILGRYKTILYFSGPYVLGHIVLGGWENRTALFIALGLLALGSGSIKPNISTLMGQIYEEKGKQHLLTEAFSFYYAAINIGSTISTFLLPWLREKLKPIYGPHTAYAVVLTIPAVLMVMAFAVFALGKKHYPAAEVAGPRANKEVISVEESARLRKAQWRTIGRLSGVFATITVFWFVYDQSASTWIYFAKNDMNLQVVGSFSTTPDQIQGLNPFLIVLLTPLFNILWSKMKERRGGRDVPDTSKMLLGFVIVTVCMAIMAVGGFLAQSGKISVWWMILATFIITLSELCISVVGLEFAFKEAAPGTKSVVTGAFWLTVFVGDVAGSFFDEQFWGKEPGKMSPGNFFLVQTVIIGIALFAFVLIARKFKHTEPVAQPAPIETPAG